MRGTCRGLCGLFLGLLLFVGCGNEKGGNAASSSVGAAGAEGAGGAGAVYPVAEADDPCLSAGLFFDGESDCDIVRCPELVCDCPSTEAVEAGEPEPPPVELTLSACAPRAGCLDRVDCARACDGSLALTLTVCEARIAYGQSEECDDPSDCPLGACREESVGRVCADVLPCSDDRHCGDGFECLIDPGAVDAETSLPTATGTCVDGSEGSLCYEDDDCVFGTCSGQRCAGGHDGDPCEFNSNCASAHCRVAADAVAPGVCVSGEIGASCLDDGDCEEGIFCIGNFCATGAEGQACDADEQCDSGICVSGRCSAGGLGAWCEDDGDCPDAFCVGARCVSGELLAPCVDADDCSGGLSCVRQLCVDGAVGSPCLVADDCAVLACVGGICRDGEVGSVCEADADCQSERCANPAGVEPGECTTGEPGSFCVYATHCVSGICDAGTCQ